MVNAKINGIPVQVAEGTTILDAARKVEVKIPTLCANDDLEPWAACGICVVKNGKSPKLIRACCTPIDEGMDIITNDAELVQTRKTVIELILSTHPDDCLACPRNQECELQRLAAEFGIREQPFPKRIRNIPIDTSTGSLILNPDKCMRCGRCVKVCQDMQNVWAIEFLGRGEKTRIAPAARRQARRGPLHQVRPMLRALPRRRDLRERPDRRGLGGPAQDRRRRQDLRGPDRARGARRPRRGLRPAPRDQPHRKIYTALRRLGFDAIFDTNFAADLTIMEEGTELVKRLTNAGRGRHTPHHELLPGLGRLPREVLRRHDPQLLDGEEPQQMMGAMIKTYYAQKAGLDPAKIYSVSIMPCTAKKYENGRDKTMYSSGQKDVDVTLTTRELARMIKQAGIDLLNLPESEPDSPLGPNTGAGVIFGATGGVMEAALRTAYNLLTGTDLKDVNFTGVRGISGIKEASVHIGGTEIRVAVAHQMGNIAQVLEMVKKAKAEGKEVPWHFIEVMACRGGCIGGGGQPYGCTDEVRKMRIRGIYDADEASEYRCSHQNPYIKQVYAEFLEKPGSHKAHELLHTHYESKPLYLK